MRRATLAAVLVVFPLFAGWASAAQAAEPATPCPPLRAAEPTADAPDDDLRTLAGWIGDARVVGLGESVHGSRTLHRLAHRVFAHLAAEEGFTVYALEFDQAHAARLDAWVQGSGDRGALDALLAERWYGSQIFYDRALTELLVWLRAENERREVDGGPPLHVAGLDMKQPRLAADAVVAALAKADPEAAGRAEALYAQALEPGAFGLFPNVSGFSGRLEVALPEGEPGAPLRVELEVRGEGVGHGSAGFYSLDHDHTLAAGEIGPAWRTLALDLERPAGDAFSLLLFHRGDGSVEFTAPRVTQTGEPTIVGDLATVTPRPLLMPKIQRMDYVHELVEKEFVDSGGRPVLRVTADPVLGRSHDASVAAEALVAGTLPGDRWARQQARLVTQAVEWRVLREPNRDLFLADNLRWLADEAFPGQRVVALAHASHAERRRLRMGFVLAEALGRDYRSVTLQATSGSYRYFGPVAEIDEDAELVLHEVAPDADGPTDCLRRAGAGEPVDAVVRVGGVEPIEPAGAAAPPVPR